MNKLTFKIDNSVAADKLSTGSKINVTTSNGDYFIIFNTSEFTTLKDNIAGVAATIVNLFNTNLPNHKFEMFIIVRDFEQNIDFFQTLKALIEISKNFHINNYSSITFMDCVDKLGNSIVDFIDMKAENKNPMNSIRDMLINNEDDEDSEDGEYDEYDESDDDEVTDIDELDFINSIYGGEEFNFESKKKNKKSKKDYYGTSRIWKNADNLKRSINRHGVVIAESKKDIKTDEKIIKQFLKDFIPGHSDWKKEFRKELLDRWMSMYTIEKKTLKKHQHKIKKNRRRNRSKHQIDPNKAIEFTRNLFNSPLSLWDDPSK